MKCGDRLRRGLLVSGVLLMLGATGTAAQRVEGVMRAGERLELTEQQIAQLDAIRRDAVARRTAEMSELAELRSRLEAGQIRRSELMAAVEERRDARQARAEEVRTSVDAILTEAQREALDELRQRPLRRRPAVGGRARDGFGPRGRPRFRRPGRRGG